MHWGSLLGTVGLALVHVFGSKLRFLDVIPRSRWLSLAGGISVAYAVLHLMPELAEADQTLSESPSGLAGGIERAAYLLTLVGLAAFYGLERLVRSAHHPRREEKERKSSGSGVFWLHIGSFAVYNALVGYLTAQEREQRALFFTALALHFLVNDFGLRRDHQRTYLRIGRWILAAAVLAGYAVGATVDLAEAAPARIVAFLAGGVILNTFKEELPEERQSRFGVFALGAAAYAAILLLTQ